MSIAVKLSAELRTWILRNLDRGCAPGDLINNMIKENFEPDLAQGIVGAFVHARNAGAPIPEDTITLNMAPPAYQYETPRLGARHQLHTTDRTVSVLLRVEQPIVAVLGEVMSDDECDQLIALSLPRLKPSTVVDPETGQDRIATHRSSDGMFFRLAETPLIATLDRRFSELMNLPMEHGEGLQVLRYGAGAQSTPHFDFLIPSNTTNSASLARSGQRISTLVVYLNDVVAGGETLFPEIGLAISPRRGHAVYFEYCNSHHQVDYKSLHAGAPVTAGEKWAVTKWMRERPFISG